MFQIYNDCMLETLLSTFTLYLSVMSLNYFTLNTNISIFNFKYKTNYINIHIEV